MLCDTLLRHVTPYHAMRHLVTPSNTAGFSGLRYGASTTIFGSTSFIHMQIMCDLPHVVEGMRLSDSVGERSNGSQLFHELVQPYYISSF
jgi:hypothetical protein